MVCDLANCSGPTPRRGLPLSASSRAPSDLGAVDAWLWPLVLAARVPSMLGSGPLPPRLWLGLLKWSTQNFLSEHPEPFLPKTFFVLSARVYQYLLV